MESLTDEYLLMKLAIVTEIAIRKARFCVDLCKLSKSVLLWSLFSNENPKAKARSNRTALKGHLAHLIFSATTVAAPLSRTRIFLPN